MGEIESTTYRVRASGCDGWMIREVTAPYAAWTLHNKRGATLASIDPCGYVDVMATGIPGAALVELFARAGLLKEQDGGVKPWMLPGAEDDGCDEE